MYFCAFRAHSGHIRTSGVLCREDARRVLNGHRSFEFCLLEVLTNVSSVEFELVMHGELFHQKTSVHEVDDLCITLQERLFEPFGQILTCC